MSRLTNPRGIAALSLCLSFLQPGVFLALLPAVLLVLSSPRVVHCTVLAAALLASLPALAGSFGLVWPFTSPLFLSEIPSGRLLFAVTFAVLALLLLQRVRLERRQSPPSRSSVLLVAALFAWLWIAIWAFLFFVLATGHTFHAWVLSDLLADIPAAWIFPVCVAGVLLLRSTIPARTVAGLLLLASTALLLFSWPGTGQWLAPDPLWANETPEVAELELEELRRWKVDLDEDSDVDVEVRDFELGPGLEAMALAVVEDDGESSLDTWKVLRLNADLQTVSRHELEFGELAFLSPRRILHYGLRYVPAEFDQDFLITAPADEEEALRLLRLDGTVSGRVLDISFPFDMTRLAGDRIRISESQIADGEARIRLLEGGEDEFRAGQLEEKRIRAETDPGTSPTWIVVAGSDLLLWPAPSLSLLPWYHLLRNREAIPVYYRDISSGSMLHVADTRVHLTCPDQFVANDDLFCYASERAEARLVRFRKTITGRPPGIEVLDSFEPPAPFVEQETVGPWTLLHSAVTAHLWNRRTETLYRLRSAASPDGPRVLWSLVPSDRGPILGQMDPSGHLTLSRVEK